MIPDDVDPKVPTTLSGADVAVAAWVAHQLDMRAGDFDPCTAIGVLLGDELVAGVVYNNYRPYPKGGVIDASIAAITPRFATRRVLHDLFAYPFHQMKVTRLQIMAAKRNKRARKFNERLGFVFEGKARRGFDGDQDAMVFSMLPEECKWC